MSDIISLSSSTNNMFGVSLNDDITIVNEINTIMMDHVMRSMIPKIKQVFGYLSKKDKSLHHNIIWQPDRFITFSAHLLDNNCILFSSDHIMYYVSIYAYMKKETFVVRESSQIVECLRCISSQNEGDNKFFVKNLFMLKDIQHIFLCLKIIDSCYDYLKGMSLC